MLVARRFGPGGYGDYMIMVAFPGFFWIVVDFGFNAIAVREIIRNEDRARDYLGNLILIRLVLATVLTLLAGLILKFLPYSPIVKLGVALNFISIFTYALFFSANAIFQSRLRYDLTARAVGSGALLNLALVGVSLTLGKGLLALIGALIVGNLVMAGVALYQARRLVGLRRITFDKKLAGSLVVTTLPVGLAIIFNLLDFKIDSLMLSVLPLPRQMGLSNRAAVGIYAAPFKILEVVLVLPTFFMNAVYPILVKRLNRSQTHPQKHFQLRGLKTLQRGGGTIGQALAVLLPSGILIGGVGYFLAPWLIRLVAGAEFTLSVGVLRILMIQVALFFVTSLLMWSVLALEKQKSLPWIYGAALILNLVLNVTFIPRYSFYAAAWITGVTELFVLLSLGWVVVKKPQVRDL